jgi:hypothetical protein
VTPLSCREACSLFFANLRRRSALAGFKTGARFQAEAGSVVQRPAKLVLQVVSDSKPRRDVRSGQIFETRPVRPRLSRFADLVFGPFWTLVLHFGCYMPVPHDFALLSSCPLHDPEFSSNNFVHPCPFVRLII